jgi:hypothetical protein
VRSDWDDCSGSCHGGSSGSAGHQRVGSGVVNPAQGMNGRIMEPGAGRPMPLCAQYDRREVQPLQIRSVHGRQGGGG